MTDQKKQFPEITKALGVQDTALGLYYQDGVPKTAPIVAACAGFTAIADLTADVGLDYTKVAAGDVVWAGYSRYQVVAAATVSPDVTTAGGVKLDLLAGGVGDYLPLAGGDLTGDITSQAGKSHKFKSADGTKTGTILQTDGDALNIDVTKVTINGDPILDLANVMDYGAVADGVTDDQAAIASAIATGKTVFIPKGTYAIGSALGVSTAGQVVLGYGATLLKTAGFAGVTLSGDRTKIYGLSVNGNGNTGSGINITGDRCVVMHCYCYSNQDGFGVVGPGAIPGADLNIIDGCEAYGNTNSGFYLNNGTDTTIVNCISQTNGVYGVSIYGQSYSARVVNCVIDDNTTTPASNGHGIYVDEGDSLRVVGCVITNTNNSGSGILFSSTTASQSGFTVSGSVVSQNEGYGVIIATASGFVSNRVILDGNRMNTNTSGSVQVQAGCTKCIITSNDLNGSAVSDSGTNTIITNNDNGNTKQGWELLETQTASGSATIDMTAFDATNYSDYMVVIRNAIPATDNVGFRCRTSTDGGATFDSGASDYADNIGVMLFTAASKTYAGSEAVDTIRLNNTVAIGSDVGEEGWSGEVTIFEPGAATKTRLEFSGTYMGSAGVHVRSDGRGVRQSAADVDAIQFYQTSGNIESGDFALYGRRKT